MTDTGPTPNLAAQLAALFVEHDPLEPWLTESHWDDHYWTNEAQLLAERLTSRMTLPEVHDAILGVLDETLPGFQVTFGQLRSDNLTALTQACWNLLQDAPNP